MEHQAAALTGGRTAHTWGPIVVNRPPSAQGTLLKAVAFNARGGRFVGNIAERLRRPPLNDPDIILLSELDWRMRRSGRHEVGAELAAELGMSFAYFGEFAAVPSADGEPVSFVGNAILSSRPLTDVHPLPLPNIFVRRRARRLLGAPAGIAAKIVVNRWPLTLGIAHLNSRCGPAGRELQIRQYLQGFPSDSAAIVGGDFNTTTVDLRSPVWLIKVMALSLMQPGRFRNPQGWEPLFERLREAGFDTSGANVRGQSTFTPSRFIPPAIRPKLDWLALRGLEPATGSAAVVPARRSLVSRRFSDHDFVMCLVQV